MQSASQALETEATSAELAGESMELTIERSALLKALGHVQSVVERRGTIPILANIKLDAGQEQLELTATDMDVAMVDVVPASITQQGAITLPAHTLYDIVRKLPDGSEVQISSQGDGKASIAAGHSKFSLSCLPVDDFPAMAEGDLAHSFVLSASECRALVEKTNFAMSTEETRYYLNGVYLHAVEEDSHTLRAVATDGHRLALQEVSLPAGASGMPGVIIPRKTVGELTKLLEEGVEDIKISLSSNKIRFVCGNAILVSKLIDGNFPDYKRVIPEGNDRVMEMDAKAFSNAVDRVSVISSDKARGVKLTLSDREMVLSASSGEQGTAREKLEVSFESGDIEVGFNARYVMDVLKQIEGETVQFVFADAAAPVLVKDTGDAGALYVIMPMRV